MAPARGNIVANTDWLIVGLYFVLVLMGLMSIYAADFNEETSEFFSLTNRSGKQLLWIGCSLVLGFVIMGIDSKIIQSFAFPAYITVVLAQLFVIFFAREVNGARAWLDLGPFKLQPAEFSKCVTALALGVYLNKLNIRQKKEETSLANVGRSFVRFLAGKKSSTLSNISFDQHLVPFGILLFPILMILLQNDTGTALVFLSFVFVLYREGIIGNILFLGISLVLITILTLMFDIYFVVTVLGVFAVLFYAFLIRQTKLALVSVGILLLYFVLKWSIGWNDAVNVYVLFGWFLINLLQNFLIPELWKKVEKLVILIGLFIALMFVFSISSFYNVLKPYQRARIDIVLGKVEDPKIEAKVGYQTNHSLDAIGSGGFTGKGYLNGTHTKGNWVPEQSTDYIFSTIGEEWGFIGSFIVIALFFTLIIRIIYRAEMQRSRASRVYGYGVACVLFFHVLVNIGMTVQLMPVIGIPLPFFSYGGSSLFGFTILLFIFVRFDSQRLDAL